MIHLFQRIASSLQTLKIYSEVLKSFSDHHTMIYVMFLNLHALKSFTKKKVNIYHFYQF